MDDSEAKRDRVLREALGYRVELLAYARALMGDYATAEDVVQEAMLVVMKKLDQFREGTSMLAWCRAIVRLEVLRAKQHRRRERTLTERLLDDAIDAGADVNAADNHGFTPLNATNYERDSNKKAKLEIAEFLRKKGGHTKKDRSEQPVKP